MKFCRYCGAQIPDDAAFCPNCGNRLQVTQPPPGQNLRQQPPPVRDPRQQMPPMPPGGRSQPYMPKTGPARPPEKKKKKFGWKRLIAVVLLAVIGFRIVSDHFGGDDHGNGHSTGSGHVSGGQTSGSGKTGSGTAGQNGAGASSAADTYDYKEWYDPAEYALAKSWKTQEIASGTLTEENCTLRAGNVSMTIEEDFFPSSAKEGDTEPAGENGSSSGALAAKISRADRTVDYSIDGVTVPLTLCDFEAEGIRDNTRMTLEIPVERPAGGTVGAGWYDPETMTIWPVSFDYDESAGVVRIHATHLSTYCGFPVENENTRGAMIAYLSDDQLDKIFKNSIGATSLRSDSYALVHSAEAEDNWDIALQTADTLGTANLVVGTVSGVTDTIGQLENGMKIAGGSGTSYVKNSIGHIGEIINTRWGRGGSMPGWFYRFHGEAVDVPLTDKLKSVYNADMISNIGTTLNVMNTGLSIFKIYNHAKNGDNTSAAWEAAQLAIDRSLAYFAEQYAFPALGVYLVGVGLFAYALDKFYSTVLEYRKEVYVKAYTKYYTKGNPEGHYRTDADWVEIIAEIMDGTRFTEVAMNRIDGEVDRYCWEFWAKYGTAEYLANLMTEDERIAVGAAGDAGIRDEIKKQISDSYKKQLMPRISKAVGKVNERNMDKVKEEWKRNYEKLRRKLNQKITVYIYDDSVKVDETSAYAGCTVRFLGVHENPYLQNKSGWETTLDKRGSGKISMTLLAHMAVNAGDVMQVISRTEKDENGEWKVLEEKQFDLSKPSVKNPTCRFTGQGPVDAQALEWFLGDWWETGEKTGERVIRVEYDEKKDSVSVRVNSEYDISPVVSDKKYVIGKDGVLLVHGNIISSGDITFTPVDRTHVRIRFGDIDKTFVREDDASKRLRPFLGIWQGEANGEQWLLTLAYREGTVVFKEVSAKSSPEEVGLLTDSYALNSKGDALTLYSGDFKGDSVTFSLRGDNGLTAVNGQGGRTNYKLRSSVNLAQMRAQPARKPGEDPKLPRGTTVMPFDPRR